MKFNFIVIIAISIIISSCSTNKQVPIKTAKTTSRNKVVIDNAVAKKYAGNEYIDRFKTIAIVEMNQYGIPASITLAQGLLESGNGNGSLAREANNHFGIKCHSEWKGKTIYKDDDQKDDCFRVYKTPEESFRDHSDFLKRKRYAFLFELDKNDYKGWAYGLKEAGYATNPKYPELLLSLIERYDLSQYDRGENEVEKIRREDKVLTQIAKSIPEEIPQESEKAQIEMKIYEVKKSDTLYSISKRFGLTVEELKILNNLQNTGLNLGALLLVSKTP